MELDDYMDISPAFATVQSRALWCWTMNERRIFCLRADETRFTTDAEIHQTPAQRRTLDSQGSKEISVNLQMTHGCIQTEAGRC